MTGGSIAKISRPVVKQALPRKRLFTLLDCMRNGPVTWVSGPGGCGKTTLVSSYISDRRLPCLWYQVDEGDQDVATFFYYMGLAVQKTSKKQISLPLLTPEYLQDIPTFTRRFFENTFSQLKRSTVFVFDNYQLIPEESGFHDVFLQGLSAVPEGLRVVLISRTTPPAALVRLQANRLMEILGWDQLRLTLEESAGIIRLRAVGIRSKETIEHLHIGADGWAAGLILMLESVKRGTDPRVLGKMPPEEVVHYFGNELFKRIDDENREFLLKTAFLPRMTVKMAEDLTGLAHAGSILPMLSRNNYFTHKRQLPEPVYEYHPLFREFLISCARQTVSREIISDLKHRAATLLEEGGQTEDAADILVELKDWEGLTGLVLKQAANLVSQGRSRTLEEWLNEFPKEMMERVPWLLYWKGVCRLLYGPAEAQLSFERAFHLFEARGDEPGAFLSWSGVVDSIYYEWDDFARLDRWIDWLDKRMQQNPFFPSPMIEARVTSSMTMALIWRQPQRPDIEEWLTRALRTSEEIGNLNLHLQNSGWAVIYYMWAGELDRLSMMVQETKRMAFSSSATPLNMISWKAWEAVYLENLVDDPHLQVQAILGGLEIADKNGIHVMDHMLFAHGVYGALSLGDLTKTEEFLCKMEASFRPSQRNMAAHYHFLAGWCQLLRGRISQAHLQAEKALKLAVETGAPVPEILARMFMSQVLHRKGGDEEASAQLAKAKGLIERFGCRSFQYQLLLTEAQFAMDRGEEEKCIKALHRGLAYGKSIGLKTMLFIWQPSVMGRLCARALENGIEVEYVRDLIRIFRLPPDEISPEIENWPWPMKIYTLGRFELIKDGKPIQFSRKAQGKPLSVLKALVASGERGGRPEDISDILWPEADGDSAYHSLQVTLHRLRSLIGHPEALQSREGCLILDSGYWWVDAWAFERFLEEANARWQEGLPERAIQLTEKAMELYRGPFLGKDVEESWAMSISERLRNKFIRSVGKLGDHWNQAGQWEKARECYQRGFDVDDLAEGFCQGLMICYQRLDQKAEALSLYQRFEKRLRVVLGVDPSEKTKALRNALLKKPSPS